MSGGHFDYGQYQIVNIIEEVETLLLQQGQVVNDCGYEWIRPVFPPEVESRMLEGLVNLRTAFIAAQRIDWLVSGDDGDESFVARYDQDMQQAVAEHNDFLELLRRSKQS